MPDFVRKLRSKLRKDIGDKTGAEPVVSALGHPPGSTANPAPSPPLPLEGNADSPAHWTTLHTSGPPLDDAAREDHYVIRSAPSSSQPDAAPSGGAGADPGTGAMPVSDQLWEDAYDLLKSQESDLVKKYEKIVSLATSKDLPSDAQANTVPADNPLARRNQMLAMANARIAKFEHRSSILEGAAMAIDVVNALSDRIAEALEASPPASLAFAGLRLILNGSARGIAASRECLEGLRWVVSRLNWYLGLAEFIMANAGKTLLGTQKPSLLAASEVVRTSLRAKVVDLFVSLIKYQVMSVCAYFQSKYIVTFLHDLANLNDWKGWRASVEDSAARLLRDVEAYDIHLAATLRSKLVRHAEESENHLRSLVQQSREAAERDARREEREQKQFDEATRAKINSLISKFSIPGLNYQTFKNSLNPEPAPNTGIWLCKHKKYEEWEAQPSGILVLAAPPGCGKSVLARSIVDKWLGEAHRDDVVCYFFFKDSPMQTSLGLGLCAVLYQLFEQRPEAILAVSDEIERASAEKLRGDPDALWSLFTKTLDHLGDAVVTNCVFDALDEAEPSSCRTLIRLLREHFSTGRAKKFKVFATCRPYEEILQPFASIKSGLVNLEAQDEELENIGHEIDYVIDHKLKLLARRERNPPPAYVVEKIGKALKAPGNRTYLWVRLVFEIIEGTSTAYREKQWLRPLESLPQSVEEAYEALLRRVPDEDQRAVREIIAIILAMQQTDSAVSCELVVSAQRELQRLDEGTYPEEAISLDAFEKWLTNTCGFLLQMFRGKVTFIHQTAKEFLRAPDTRQQIQPPLSGWKHSFVSRELNRTMAEVCVSVLDDCDVDTFASNTKGSLEYHAKSNWESYFSRSQYWDKTDEGIPGSLVDIRQSLIPKYLSLAEDIFIRDSLTWQSPRSRVIRHLRFVEAVISSGEERRVFRFLTQLCNSDEEASEDAALWILHYFPSMATRQATLRSSECRHKKNNTTLLHLARRATLIRRLRACGADLAAKDCEGRTPLHIYVHIGRWGQMLPVACAELAIEAGADIHGRDFQGRMPVHVCSRTTVNILISKGADVNARDRGGYTPLHTCFLHRRADLVKGIGTVVRKLIQHGADVDAVAHDGRTPLHLCRDPWVTKILLDGGADPRALDTDGRSPLHYAEYETAYYLLKHGASLTPQDRGGEAALHCWAGWHGEDHFYRGQRLSSMLNSANADFVSALDLQDKHGSTALMVACQRGRNDFILFLLQSGANANIPDAEGLLPLQAYINEDSELSKARLDGISPWVASKLVKATGNGLILSGFPGFLQRSLNDVRSRIIHCGDEWETGSPHFEDHICIDPHLFEDICTLLDHGLRLKAGDDDPEAAMFAPFEDDETRQRFRAVFDSGKGHIVHALFWKEEAWKFEGFTAKDDYLGLRIV